MAETGNGWLFSYRGLKGHVQLHPTEMDANGEIISDIYYGEDGSLRSKEADEMFVLGDIYADELARRARPEADPHSVAPRAVSPPTAQPPPPRQRTNYAPPRQAARECPECGWPTMSVKKPWGTALECTNSVPHGNPMRDGGFFPFLVR